MPLDISPERKLIVLHTPKCGGSSLYSSLCDAYGRRSVYRHYEGKQVGANKGDVARYPVIIGHARVVKYESIKDATWITLLRDPVDRTLSHYLNWRHTPMELLRNSANPLRQLVSEGKLSLLDFARTPKFASFLSKWTFGEIDMNRFSLVIWHDDYAAGIATLSDMIGHDLTTQHKNISASRSEAYEDARERTLADAPLMAELRNILSEDIAFYERVRATHGPGISRA